MIHNVETCINLEQSCIHFLMCYVDVKWQVLVLTEGFLRLGLKWINYGLHDQRNFSGRI